MADHQPYVTIRSRMPAEGPGSRSTGPPMVRCTAYLRVLDITARFHSLTSRNCRLALVGETFTPDPQLTTSAVQTFT